jgi:L-asparaginase II
MSANPILVEVYRGGVLESFHRGAVCVVNQKGEIIFSLGDPQQVCYPRSAMKLLQVLPLIINGGIEAFGFTLEEIAVMCGSHNAEADHLRVVRSILSKTGCTEEQLQCGAQYPTSKKDADELLRKGVLPSAIHNNCSGKHAGMLAMCKLFNTSAQDYLEPEHPVQQHILDVCERMYEYPRSAMHTALDGCSAPIFSVPVYHQAVAYKNLVDDNLEDPLLIQACKIVVEAVSKYPFMVAGSKRYCTDMMKVSAPHVIGKTGAEGVFCMTFTKQKLGLCIKIDDGKMQPQYNVAQALLEASGIFTNDELQPLHHYVQAPIRNFNKLETGEIKVNGEFFKDFRACLM